MVTKREIITLGSKSPLNEIQEKLAALSDPEDARFLQGFFKTGSGQYGYGDLFRGIRVPVLRKLSKSHKAISVGDAEQLLHSAYHEDRLLALFILMLKYAAADEAGKARIFTLYLDNTGYINNWDLVDASAAHIVGAHLKDRPRTILYELAGARSLWERRIAILATFHFIRCGQYDDTLKIAAMLIADKEDLLHKAVGWLLREVGKRDLQTEETFLIAHYRQMPRTMLRYAIERFPEEKRKAYLKGDVD
jgi:3-methyladenine DNA glycosylase AlkD